MANLQALLKQQRELEAQIHKAREETREAAIAKILEVAEEAGLTAADICNAFPMKIQRKTNTRASPKVKYKDNKGNTWSGRGALPRWVRDSGKPKEAFLIKE